MMKIQTFLPPDALGLVRLRYHAATSQRLSRLVLNIIKVEGLTKRYARTVAVDNISFEVEKGQIVAHKSSHFTGMYVQSRGGTGQYFLSSPALFFLPEHADLPQTMHGAKLWAEVTVPKNGPPRPIQLAVKRGNAWMPLTYK